MAISGKRFQITDGASTPTNLFPYTVTEAVYGLSTVLANTQSAAVSEAATSAASLYLPLSAGSSHPLTNSLYVNANTSYALYLRGSSQYSITRYLDSSGNNVVDTGWINDARGNLAFMWNLSSTSVICVDTNGCYYSNDSTPKKYTIYHSGNSNKPEAAWQCSTLTTSAAATFGSYIVISNNNGVYIKNSGGTARSQLYVDANNNTLVGYGATQDGTNTTIYGTNILFATSANRTEYMRITSGGLVGIGIAPINYRLDVAGTVRFYSQGNPTLTLKRNTAEGGCSMDMFPDNQEVYGWRLASERDGVGRAFSFFSVSNTSTYTQVLSLKPDISARVGADTQNFYATYGPSYISLMAGVYTGGWNANIGVGRNGTISGFLCGAYLAGGTINYYWYGGPSYTTAAVYILPSGNVGIGTNSPSAQLTIKRGSTASSANILLLPDNQETYGWLLGAQRDATLNRRFSFYYRNTTDAEVAYISTTGTLTTSGDQVISSDLSLKTNLQDVTYTIEDIAKTRAVTFDWKDGRGKSAGSIAQDWKPLIPELVHGEEGNMTLAYGQIALVNSILLAKHETEQDKEIARLKARVKELETRLNIS